MVHVSAECIRRPIATSLLMAAIALFGFCLLTALFFHTASDQVIELQKNVAMAGGFLTLTICGAGPWSLDAWRGRAG